MNLDAERDRLLALADGYDSITYGPLLYDALKDMAALIREQDAWIERLRADADHSDLLAWIRDVQDLIEPLSYLDGEQGKQAEGLGQHIPGLLERYAAIAAERLKGESK